MGAEAFGGRLRELREAAGLTQQQLAERANVSARAVAQWEQGSREPGWSSILALAQALDVTCEAFTREPAERPPVGPGRPPKPDLSALPGGEREVKKPRGRPKKGS